MVNGKSMCIIITQKTSNSFCSQNPKKILRKLYLIEGIKKSSTIYKKEFFLKRITKELKSKLIILVDSFLWI